MENMQERPFSNRGLVRLLIPLVIEQLLMVTVGLADSLMVSGLGEAAVSAVSLVDTVTVFFTNLLSHLAAGSAIIVGQYLGAGKRDKAQGAADQMLLFAVSVALVLTILVFALRKLIIGGLFGSVEPAVAENATRYFNIVELSIVPLSIYFVGSSLFRITGNTSTTMCISLLMNIINVVGNASLIYGAKIGVAGAAIPTLASRIFGALMVVCLLKRANGTIYISIKLPVRFERKTIAQIVRTGVPNAVEGSVFQLGKILLISVVATFGTSAITANAIGNTLMMFQELPAMATCMAMSSVISFCVGKGMYEKVGTYIKKLLKFAYVGDLVINVIIFVLLDAILRIYHVSPETNALAKVLITSFGIATILLWPLSFTFPNALRAAGDTRVVMGISIISMLGLRLLLGIVLAKMLKLGVFGIWIAMYIDWAARSLCFILRYRSGTWKTKSIVSA